MKKLHLAAFIIVYFIGVITQGVLFGLTLVWGITGTLAQNTMAIPIMIAQAILLMSSGRWWLPIAAKITGAVPGEQP